MGGEGDETTNATTTTAAPGVDDDGYDEFLSTLNAPSGESTTLSKPTTDDDDDDDDDGNRNNKFDHEGSDTTQPLSFSEYSNDGNNDGEGDTIIYTDKELIAMRAVRHSLVEEHSIPSDRVNATFLAIATINCKLQVEETVAKIKKLLEIMSQLGCPDGIAEGELWKAEAAYELHPYPMVGKDGRGCSTTWIRGGGKVKKEDERAHVHACIMQYLSVHSDPNTLRNGVSFIIDLSARNDDPKLKKQPKVGNEKLIQSFYQAIPQRPQIIMIAGCSLPTRAIVNVSIRLASVFIKQKILQRIHFVTVEDAVKYLGEGSAPGYTGRGKMEGGLERYGKWVEERLGGLPKPDL
mmetsp:Transcript_16704/g.26981  ORF Transcript_16704/g.26981 Transcript_16704/m.26981 type:complete len:350 (+) Transcript_16704:149-1198(+)|eukprot:CAMPEP_0196158592 /NCGR_PEP_ID=MMETSP0910-20130528/45890_1 /TAXON_ID=49265 /ORGANISM="Thalassiosira rotula, Strain GSO102" /LENGTH=349 /DNA_ID=CAMNT_0041423497 /DNA_START=1211 /DNA_END=2260 /DNA_ORIENTATION=-